MSETLKLPREFQPIENYREMLGYLSEGTKIHASTMIWTKDQDHVVQTELRILSQVDKIFYTRTPNDFDIKEMYEALKKNGSNECFFSVSLQSANLFFKAKFRGQDTTGLKFETPTHAYKVQRRGNVRFQIPAGHLLWLEFQDPRSTENTLKRKIIDISAGGLAFAASDENVALFTRGLILESLRLTIRNTVVCGQGEVRHKKGTKVGIIFKNLAQNDRELIAAYVFEESRKYFMRFL